VRLPRGAPVKQVVARVDAADVAYVRAKLKELRGMSLSEWLQRRIEEAATKLPTPAVEQLLSSAVLQVITEHLPDDAAQREAVVMALLDWPDDAILAAMPGFRFADAVRQADIGRLIDLLRVATKQMEADRGLAALNLTPPTPAKRKRKKR